MPLVLNRKEHMDSTDQRLTVACVQQRVFLPATHDEFYHSLQRFLRVTDNKHAKLVVFPELAGFMTAAPTLDDLRANLLKRADRGSRRDASLWQKLVGMVSSASASYLRADLRRSIAGYLDVAARDAWDAYVKLYSSLAREFDITLVAPSSYLPDPLDGVIRNLSAVFGRDGALLGTQAKVVLHPTDADLAQPGSTWDVIQTEVGRIGLIIGGDVLYPEVGRLHAYQGADILVTQAACLNAAMYNKVRSGVLARMQDNQLFAVASFLVGPNVLSRDRSEQFIGKSAILSPQELTPKSNGVLVEMGGVRSEGVVAAEWDFDELRNLWESSDTPIRRTLSSTEVHGALGEIYARMQRLPPVAESPLLPSVTQQPVAALTDTLLSLDDLPVVSTFERLPNNATSETDGTDEDGTDWLEDYREQSVDS